MLISDYHIRQQRNADKRRILLRFLREEIWSSAGILQALLGLSNSGIYKSLAAFERDGLITSYFVAELNHRIWGITTTGLFYAWDDGEIMNDRPAFQPSKVKAVRIRHHLDLQLVRLKADAAGWTKWTLDGNLPKGLSKRPDAVVINPRGERIAIELERTVKTRKRYEVIISEYLQAIKRGDYHYIHYVCPDKDFSLRLKKLIGQIKTVPVGNERVIIGEKHHRRFHIRYLSDWPVGNMISYG